MSKGQCTIWIAYNTYNECFASHESAQEAVEGLVDTYSHGEGLRVVELSLTLPSVKPLSAQAAVPDHDGQVIVTID